ncbi:MAG TPA: hypothetical protein VNY36_07060 [Bacteroidia bacterium]|jgi:hypothetical protein|nr:hypothetical protein [Bacteroidia bacterium]
MKKLFVLLSLFMGGNLLAQQGHIEITPVYNGFRDVITYDARNNKISDIEQEFLNGRWQNIGINKTTYDEHNNALSSISQYGWQCFFTYDKRNNRTGFRRQYKHDSGYVNVEQYFYTYDTSNTKTSELLQTWDGKQWVNKSKQTFSHTLRLEETWDGKEWVNSRQTIYTYDDRGNAKCTLAQNWNGKEWVNSERWLYTFDANNKQTSYTDQVWNGTEWGPWQPMRDGIPRK